MSKADITEYSGRAYTWSLMTYAKPDEYQRLLDETKHWALCHHDKDFTIDDNGNEKLVTPHTHILCTFEKWISLEQIQKIIASDQNTMGECRRKCGDTWVNLNIGALFEYLIHQNDPNKHPYDREERKTDGTTYWNRFDTVEQNSENEQFLTDLLAPYKSDNHFNMTMARKYGKDFIKNRSEYWGFRMAAITYEIAIQNYDNYEPLLDYCIKEDIPPYEALRIIKDHTLLKRGIYVE